MMQTINVKQHDYNSNNFQVLDNSQEPSLSSTVQHNYITSVKRYMNENYMSYRAGMTTQLSQLQDSYVSITYGESAILIKKLIQKLGEILENDYNLNTERVMLYAKNSPAWLLTDLAVGFMNGILSPLYDTLGLDNVCYCTNTVDSHIVVVSSEYLPVVLGALEHLPNLKLVYCFDKMSKDVGGDDIVQFELNDDARGPFIQKIISTRAQLSSQDFHGTEDDNHSMYSIASRTSGANQSAKADGNIYEQIKGQQEAQDDIKISKGRVEINNHSVQVYCGFPQLSPDESGENNQNEITSAIEFLENLLKQNNVLDATQPNSIIFTSGTSGRPKCVVASHTNVNSGGACLGRRFVPYHYAKRGKNVQNRFLSYLPLPHVFERNCEHLATFRGYNIFYSSGNIRNLPKDLQLSQPTVLLGVPRVYCKIYQVVMSKLNQAGKLSKAIFWSAFHTKKFFMAKFPHLFKSGRFFLTDWVFNSIVAGFGGKVEFFVTGSSSLPLEVLEFMEVCAGGAMTRGYGLTEASATGFFCYCGQGAGKSSRDQNLLGFACYETEAKIVDRSDASGRSLEHDMEGELLMKGPGIVLGRIKDKWPQIESVTDENGFYHTGDLVKLNPDGSISFKRRVGLVVKLQQGEFVDLEAVESALESSPMTLAAIVHAEADRPAPVALINLDGQALLSRLEQRQNGLSPELKAFIEGYKNISYVMQMSANTSQASIQRLLNNPLYQELETFICEEGRRLIISKGLKGFNVPKAYFIHIDADWAADPALYTSTQKKRHGEITRLFMNHIKALWNVVDQREKPASKNLKKQNIKKLHKYNIKGAIGALSSILIVTGIAVGLGLTKHE